MPRCKNDPNKFYKGTEPCPKGLGHCPHMMKIGTIMVGKDGKFWIIKKLKRYGGKKDWVKTK